MPWIWVAETTAVAAAMALVALVASRWARRKPALCHALWLLVILKMLTPPIVRLPLPTLFRPAGESLAVSSPASAQPSSGPRPVGAADPPPPPTPAPIPPPIPRFETSRLAQVLGSFSWSSAGRWAIAVWVVGSAIALTRQIWAFRYFERRRRRGAPAPDWLTEQTEQAAAKLGVRAPRAVLISGIGSPAIWCWGRPCLLVPDSLVDSLDAKRWRMIIAHELAHVGRRDHWIVWLELAALVLWWWHPLFWLARRRLRIEADRACDAWAASAWPQERRTYADALLDICQIANPQHRRTVNSTAALGLGDSGRILEKRLIMILERKPVTSRLSKRAIAVLGVLTLAVFPGWSWSQQGRDPRQIQAERRKQFQEEQRLQDAVANAVRSVMAPRTDNEHPGPPAETLDQEPAVAAAKIAMERAGIRLEIADSEVQKAKAELNLRQAIFARAKRLAGENAGAVSPDEIRRIEAEIEVAIAALRVKTAEHKEAAIDSREAKQAYDKEVKSWEARKANEQAERRAGETRKTMEKILNDQEKQRQAARKAEEERIAKEFQPQIYRAKVGDFLLVEVLEALPGRPITGERVVRGDGTISLGWYGEIKVIGLTRSQIKEKIVERLRLFLNDEALGLFKEDYPTEKLVTVPPAESDRVFVDELVSGSLTNVPAPRAGSPNQGVDRRAGRAGPGADLSQITADDAPKSALAWEALGVEMDFEFGEGSKLKTLLDMIKAKTQSPKMPKGVSFYLDPVAFKSQGLHEDAATFSLHLPSLSLKTGLGLALRELDLMFCIKDGLIIITSTDRIHEFVDTRFSAFPMTQVRPGFDANGGPVSKGQGGMF